MSARLSSRNCWRECLFRRLYSSSAEEPSQPPRHAPIAIDLGGIQIGSARFVRQKPRPNPLDLRDFKHGTLSQRLAITALQQRHQNTQSQNVTERHSASQHPRQRQNVDSGTLIHQHDGAYAQSRQPRQRRRNTDMQPNQRYPNQQRVQRKPRRVKRNEEWEGMAPNEEEEMDAIDDDVNATKTSFRLRRPDPRLAPSRKPRLPPSLTTLEQKIYVDIPTHELLEQQGGNYVRYFSPEEWQVARAQSSAPLGVVDYARLALHLNRTVPVGQRKEGVDVIRRHVEKADAINAAP